MLKNWLTGKRKKVNHASSVSSEPPNSTDTSTNPPTTLSFPRIQQASTQSRLINTGNKSSSQFTVGGGEAVKKGLRSSKRTSSSASIHENPSEEVQRGFTGAITTVIGRSLNTFIGGALGARPLEQVLRATQACIVSDVCGNAGMNDPFALALQRHIDTLTDEERSAFLKTDDVSAGGLLRAIEDLDSEHYAGSSLRKCATKVKGFLDAVDGYLSILGIAIQHSPQISSLIVGGLRLVVDVGRRMVDFFTLITDTMHEMGKHLYYLAEIASLYEGHHWIKVALCDVYGDLLDICKMSRKVYLSEDGNPSRYTSANVMIGSNVSLMSDVKTTYNRFKDHIDIVTRTAAIEEQKRLRQKEEDGIVRLKDKDAKERANADESQTSRRYKVLSWLSSFEFERDHDRILRKRFGKTGDWLLKSSNFLQWINSQESCLLWCHGTPGVGKSVLTSVVLQHIRATKRNTPSTRISYVYFNYQVLEVQRPVELLCVILKQLCRDMAVLPEELTQLYFIMERQGMVRPSLESIEAILEAVLTGGGETMLVIDAMDECLKEYRDYLLPYLTKLLQAPSFRLKVFVTSRVERDIRTAFSQEFKKMEIEAKKVQDDITLYVDHFIESRREEDNLCMISSQLKQTIKDCLISQSNGMFLWVECMLQFIYSQPSADAILKELRSLPSDINSMYIRILKKIDSQAPRTAELARRALMWTLAADRLFTLSQLTRLLAADEDTMTWEDLETKYKPQTIIDACFNLLVVDKAGVVRPIHQTTHELLTSKPTDTELGSVALIEKYSVDPSKVDLEFLRSCLKYMLLYYSYRERSPGQYIATSDYALSGWADHLNKVSREANPPDDVIGSLKELLTLSQYPYQSKMVVAAYLTAFGTDHTFDPGHKVYFNSIVRALHRSIKGEPELSSVSKGSVDLWEDDTCSSLSTIEG